MQTTSHFLMIRPVHFTFNIETAANNSFQSASTDHNVAQNARNEFDGFVQVLTDNGIDVTVVEDTPEPHTPDSIFPNNWISFHDDGTVFLYPMFARNRRAERKEQVLSAIARRFNIYQTIDLTAFEQQQVFLEGTGSMVLDRQNKIAYACLSARTDVKVLNEFCNKSGYTPVDFISVDEHNNPIYHTNVMMCVADQYVVICLDSIPAKEEKNKVMNSITKTGKEIIAISFEQMNHFAGNMLQVQNKDGEKLLVMSTQAYQSLTNNQLQQLNACNPIIHFGLNTIEQNGGGSARCMMAEVFLPLK